MSKWEMVRLGDVFSYIRNGASIKQEANASGYPITRIETISDGLVNRERMGYADIEDITPYTGYILHDGDILMSHINSVKHLGKVALYSRHDGEDIIHGMNLLNLRAAEKQLDGLYAFYFLRPYYFRKQLPNITKNSVNQSSFNITALKELEIPLPPLPVQQQIADVLDQASALMAKRKAQIEKLDLLIKSRFIEMFGDLVTNDKGWDVKRLDQIADSRLGKMLDSKRQTGNDRYPYLANFNVQWFRFDLEKLNEMDFDKADRNEFALEYGDLLVCEGGEVGRTAIWKNEKHDCFFQKAIHRVRCRSDECIPEYLAWVMYQKAMNTNFDGLVTSATISHLTGVKLKGLQIQIPPLELQHHFADFVHQADKSKFELQQGMNQLEFLYKSLMQKSFNGEMFQCSLN